MKALNRPSGPFQETLFFDLDDIDNICLDALRKVNQLPSSPQAIDVERFAEKYFKCEIGYEDLPEGVMGFTAFDSLGKVKTIRIQKSLEDGTTVGERRVRSTWAHECGHGLLHASLFIQLTDRTTSFSNSKNSQSLNQILCRDSDIKAVGKTNYDGRWWEWQANRCIGGLLLPKLLLLESIKDSVEEGTSNQKATIPSTKRAEVEKSVSDTFNVSLAVAKIRLQELFPDPESK